MVSVFCFHWPIKIQEVREAELTVVRERTWNLTTPPIIVLPRKSGSSSPPYVFKKDVKIFSQINFAKWER